MEKENEVLNLGEVSALVRLCRITVYKYVKQGRIPGAKAGNRWRFTRSQVLRALEAGFPFPVKDKGTVKYQGTEK